MALDYLFYMYILESSFLCCLNLMYVLIVLVKLRWLGGRLLEMAARSTYDMSSKYKYLISHFGFRSGNFFLIAPFPDHYLLVPFLLRRALT